MGVHNNVEGYEDLANAIVKRAALDYQKALCEDDKKVIKECLKFFKSNGIVTSRILMVIRLFECSKSRQKR